MQHRRWTLLLPKTAGAALLVLATIAACAADEALFGDSGTGASAGAGGSCANGFFPDPSLGCVQCTSDAGCDGAHPFCVAGACVECGVSSDCGAGESCFPENHECEPSCASSDDCSSGDASLCDVPSGACVECVDSTQCQQGVCNPTFGICAECLGSEDCAAGEPYCQVDEGRCRECLADVHCAPGDICSGHHCAPATCASDADCAEDEPRCDVPSGSCRECLSDADCAGGSDPRCGRSGECVRCLTDDDCGGGQCEDQNCKGGG